MDEVISVDLLREVHHRPVPRVYLGSALTNVTKRRAAEVREYRKIITDAIIRSLGAVVYDPAEHTAPGSNHSHREVCQINHRQVVRSDFFICLATDPSCGLGIESQTAAHAVVPRLLILPHEFRVSRMLLGTVCHDVTHVVFRTAEDLHIELAARMPEILRMVTHFLPVRRQLLSDMAEARRGRAVLRNRILLGMTRSELSQRAMVHVDLIEAIEHDEQFAMVVGGPQWSLLASTLNCKLVQHQKRVPEIESLAADPNHVVRQSLDNLVDFVIEARPADEPKINRIWQHYHEMQSQAVAGRDDLDNPIEIPVWRDLYDAEDEEDSLFR